MWNWWIEVKECSVCVTLYYKLACTVYICWVGGVNVKVVDRGKGPVVECSVWNVELFTINLHVLYVCVCVGGGGCLCKCGTGE